MIIVAPESVERMFEFQVRSGVESVADCATVNRDDGQSVFALHENEFVVHVSRSAHAFPREARERGEALRALGRLHRHGGAA